MIDQILNQMLDVLILSNCELDRQNKFDDRFRIFKNGVKVGYADFNTDAFDEINPHLYELIKWIAEEEDNESVSEPSEAYTSYRLPLIGIEITETPCSLGMKARKSLPKKQVQDTPISEASTSE